VEFRVQVIPSLEYANPIPAFGKLPKAVNHISYLLRSGLKMTHGVITL
jgi:hypothetical protein